MNNFYQNKHIKSIIGILLLFVGTFFNTVTAQTTISTEPGTNYTGANGVTGNGVITFVVQNNNAAPILLSQVDVFWATANTGSVPKLWYSATSLSGAPTVASPAWTLAATGTAITVAAPGYLPTFTGLSITIPANTQYRFALESNIGISYSGSGTITPTPNTFTAGGVTLKCGNSQISAFNIGYGGGFPSPANNPRFFTGRIKFDLAAAPTCASNLAPANNTVNVAPNGSLTWAAASGAASYDVYLGTAVNPPFVANVTGTSYTFSPLLTLGEQYFYKIVPKNGVGAATGCAVNAFTVASTFCLLPSVFTVSNDTSFCGTGSVNIKVNSGSLNDATQWAWYTGSCGGTPAGTGTTITVSPTATTTYYVRPEGGCVGNTISCKQIVVTKTTNIGAPVINPASPICLNSTGTLSINPLTIVYDSVVVVSAANLSIVAPDNVSTGASTTLTVPAIPAGSIITGMEISLSMTHTYPGDMIFNLKAPNGSVLNLYKYGTGLFTGNNGNLVGAGWFNTIISSASTRAFSTINAAPYNYGAGPFRADLINTPVTGPTVQNPDGFAANATSFNNLYSTPAGTWTLALADGGPGDVGALTRWSIKIKYSSTPTPASPAVWSPASSLFTNPAATIPYDGTTPVFTVYAKPSTTTTYTAISTSGSCVSDPVNVVQTVSVPASVSQTIANKTICEFDENYFVAPTTGNRPAFQWYYAGPGINTAAKQIVNDANFGGATSDTLFFKNLSVNYNGYRFYCKIVAALPCLSADGIDSSNMVTLTINPTPTIALSSSPYSKITPGQIATIQSATNPQGVTYNWFRNNVSVVNSNFPQIAVDVDSLGYYKVAIVDINGCKNTSDVFEISEAVSTNLFVYPNPNNGNFQVRYYSTKGNKPVRTMLIYDSKGALVYNKVYTTAAPFARMDVNFKSFSKGIYAIILLDAAGKRLATGKASVN